MKILGIDLGKYNSVACLLDPETQETLFFPLNPTPMNLDLYFLKCLLI